jgi:hypothetical protein
MATRCLSVFFSFTDKHPEYFLPSRPCIIFRNKSRYGKTYRFMATETLDSTKRRVAAYWRPVSYLTAIRLICPHRLAPLKLQRGGKRILGLNSVF